MLIKLSMKNYLVLVNLRTEFKLGESKLPQVRQFGANFQKNSRPQKISTLQSILTKIHVLYLCAVLGR